jgi:glycosylphosphatidylinositol transamidase (GPIT) subunit GPI8
VKHNLFTIRYQLHGEPKSFIVRAAQMNNAQAWHWASCDAGVAIIPRFGQHTLKRVSKPMAEKYGITDVRWSGSEEIQWAEGLTQ